MYQEIGDTAFVTFDSFRCLTDDEFFKYYDPENAPDPETFVIPVESANEDEDLMDFGEEEEQADVDTIWLLMYAHKMITREGSPAQNSWRP